MDHSLLPIDLCEEVIDGCYYPAHSAAMARSSDYVTLMSCALVCSAWLPRARFNLLSRVTLMDPIHLDRLLWTLSTQPHLAGIISELTVLGSGGYIPFADLHIRQYFQHCRRLELRFSS